MRILFCNYEYPPIGGGGVINALPAERLANRLRGHGAQFPGARSAPASLENSVRVLRVPVLLRHQRAVANLPSLFAYMFEGVLRGRRLLEGRAFPT
jgi:hypothetical protein